MNNNNIGPTVKDFYALVKLRGEDDEECSRAEWLRCQVSDFGGEEEEGEPPWCWWRFRRRCVTKVKDWADAKFKNRPEYYVCIVERRSQEGYPLSGMHMVYMSPNLGARLPRVSGNVNSSQFKERLASLERQLDGIVADDDQRDLL